MKLTYYYNEEYEILSIFEIINPGFWTESFREIESGIHLSKEDFKKYKEMLNSDDSIITAMAIEIIKNKI